MQRILILGANGKTAQIVIGRLLSETDDQLVLYLRNSQRLARYANQQRVTIIDGDVQEMDKLQNAMRNIDVVYSNIGGVQLGEATQGILEAMEATSRKRLVFYSALGAEHEVPGRFGEWNEQAIADFLPGFRAAAKLIEQTSAVVTTQIRPAWLTDNDEINYELTHKNELFKGTEVSRQSVADFVVTILKNPDQYQNDSIGLNKPGTDGDQPSWLA
ncbi:NAD(P)H-binding protein [Latilactobacillus sp. 5-91]|uniref:NAD(P)H-binding protein n=1 Tax=Latilactobacillus sp. 5-91 TaxID=3410924 RepID=UPI003C758424